MSCILVIDDEAQILKILSNSLTRAGHRVVLAENGATGLELCKKEPIDLVLTDIVMPGGEGLETIAELKQTYKEIKIIAMSGGGRISSANYLETAKKLGADAILAKPFRRRELLELVAQVLAQF